MTRIGVKFESEHGPGDYPADLRLRPWHPDIPRPLLCLHEKAFERWHSRNSDWVYPREEYQVLYHCNFGGPRGIFLDRLVKVHFWVENVTDVLGIAFEYHCQVNGKDRLTLGICGPYSLEFEATLTGTCDHETFEIDGPNGERFDAVEVGETEMRHLMFKVRVTRGSERWQSRDL